MASTLNSAETSAFKGMLKRFRASLPNRRIRFTAQGIWLTLLTLGVGFAALNTGNNLLYLVLGMMLTFIGVSGILSELSIQGMGVKRAFSTEIYCDEETPVSLTLENHKRVFPAMGVRVMEIATLGVLDVDTTPAFIVFLPAEESTLVQVPYVFKRRGVHAMPRPLVETTYPFGLFSRGYRSGAAKEVLVFPKLIPVDDAQRAPPSGGGEEVGRRKGMGDEFFGLRAFQVGDDIRQVHWKSSAKRDRLVVRESLELTRRRVIVRLEAGDGVHRDAFEEGVTLAASWVHALLGQGMAVGFEGPEEAIPPGEGRAQLRRILTALALVGPSDGPVPFLPGPVDQDRRFVVVQRGAVVKGGWR